MANAFRDGAIRTTGTDIDKILPAMSRFGGGNRQEKKKTVIEKLKGFFEKYFGVEQKNKIIFCCSATKDEVYLHLSHFSNEKLRRSVRVRKAGIS